MAHNGKFGPYLKKGTDTRSLASEDQILTVTLPEAQALFAQPKQRRGRTAAAPLRELGPTRPPQLPVVVKEGRFGPYVTDGTTNASLRKGDAVESITMERASELLAERRAAGPSTRKKAGAKKAGGQEGRARPRRRGTKKAAGAKKAAGTQEGRQEGDRGQEGGRATKAAAERAEPARTVLTWRHRAACSRSRGSTAAASRPRPGPWPRHSGPA